jgi:hypothetical protein
MKTVVKEGGFLENLLTDSINIMTPLALSKCGDARCAVESAYHGDAIIDWRGTALVRGACVPNRVFIST